MDENIRLTGKVVVQDLFHLLHFPVALFQGQIPGQDEVEVDEDPAAGPAGPELVHVDPEVLVPKLSCIAPSAPTSTYDDVPIDPGISTGWPTSA